MLVKIPKPSQTSLVFLDTSVIIDYLLGDLGIQGFSGLLEKRIREFLNEFIMRGIKPRITLSVKGALKYRRDIIRREAIAKKLPPRLFAIVDSKVEKRFNALQKYLRDDSAGCSQLIRVKDFYTKHQSKREFVECRSSKNPPSPLPEESDMTLLAEIANYRDCCLLTADCDFHTLDEEILKEFGVFVISDENMFPVMDNWGWSLPS